MPGPPLAALDAFEQESGRPWVEPHERADRRLRIGQDLAPHRYDEVIPAQLGEPLRGGVVTDHPREPGAAIPRRRLNASNRVRSAHIMVRGRTDTDP